MTTFLTIAPDGRRQQLSFPTDHEAEVNAETMRKPE